MHQPGLEPGTNDLKDRYSAIELLVQKPSGVSYRTDNHNDYPLAEPIKSCKLGGYCFRDNSNQG